MESYHNTDAVIERVETKCSNCDTVYEKEVRKDGKCSSLSYCELCTMSMMEPLISNQVQLAEYRVEYSKKIFVVHIPLEINEEQAKKLDDNISYLNLYVLCSSKSHSKHEEIVVFFSGEKVKMKTDQFNLLNWATITKNKYQSERDQSDNKVTINISITIDPFEGTRVFYISLANLISEGVLFSQIISRKASQITEDRDLKSLKNMIAKSAGKSVPVSLSVLCPLTMQLLDYPGKGLRCKHADFFSVKSYLTLNLNQTNYEIMWRCPHCKEKVYCSDLFIDDLMQDTIVQHRDYFLDPDIDLSGSLEQIQHEDDGKNKVNAQKRYKLYIFNGEILTPDDLDKQLKKHQGTSKPSLTLVQLPKSPDHSDELQPISVIMLQDQKSENETLQSQVYIEISEADVRNYSIDFESLKKEVDQSLNKEGLRKDNQLKNELERCFISIENTILHQNLTKDQKESSLKRGKMNASRRDIHVSISKSILIQPKEDPLVSSKSEFINFSSSKSKIENEFNPIYIKDLETIPDRQNWTVQFISDYTDALEKCSSIISSMPRDMTKMAGRVYTLSLSKSSSSPDLDMLIKYGWFISQNLDPTFTSLYFGQFMSSICLFFKNKREFITLLISFLMKKEVLTDLGHFQKKGKLSDNIIRLERLSQFIFGWTSIAHQPLIGENEVKDKQNSLENEIELANFVLSQVFKPVAQVDGCITSVQNTLLHRYRELSIKSTCLILAKFLSSPGRTNPTLESEDSIYLGLCKGLIGADAVLAKSNCA
jgi:hypothetical protein